jgi:hypothetical protein
MLDLKVSLSPVRNLDVSTELGKLPCDLKNATAHHLDDSVLLIGGWDGHRTLRTIFSYNLDRGTTSSRALLPCAIEGHAMCSVNGGEWLVVSGGFDGVTVVNTILLHHPKSGQTQVLTGLIARVESACMRVFVGLGREIASCT